MYNLLSKTDRPDKSEGTDSEKYHLDMGRYSVYSGFNDQYNDWINQYFTNMLFTFGNQWIIKEDLEAFLKDDSDQSRNRIKVKKNMILPTVSQYVGNAISMDMTVRCMAISPKAVNRRERKLEELLFVTEVAQGSNPLIREEFKKRYGIGDTLEDTERMFSNLWQDNYVKTMNMLMEYIAEINNFSEKKRMLAQNLAWSGLVTMKYTPYNQDMKWDIVPPERFFFDHTAIKQDLSDSEFMGDYDLMLPSALYELYPKALDFKTLIDKAVQSASSGTSGNGENISDGKVPVYKSYWVDSVEGKYGYVLDEFGYPYYTKIDYVEEGAKEPKYTMKDIIPYKDLNESQKKMVSKSGVARKYFDCIKFVIFIPKEALASGGSNNTDVVLDYGDMPYQDTEYYNFASAKFPYKNYCWYYNNGFIFTPVSELINPQRMINRLASVNENLANTAMPGSFTYDKTMVEDEGEFLRNIYQGKANGINARGMGVQNAVLKVSTSLDVNSISAYDMMAESMRLTMDRIIGVNDSMKGQSQGQDQLVGVTALQIQRASLIQEPYYDAIAKLFEQVYQASANVGKRIYVDNERELAVAVGDGNLQVIKLTREFNTEDFRAFIHRQPNMEQQKQVANQQLMQFVQLQLIDKKILSDLWDRATPTDVAEALRMSAKIDAEVAVRQARVQQEQQGAMQQAEQQGLAAQIMQKNQERTDMLANNQLDRDNKREMKETEVVGKIASAEIGARNKQVQENNI